MQLLTLYFYVLFVVSFLLQSRYNFIDYVESGVFVDGERCDGGVVFLSVHTKIHFNRPLTHQFTYIFFRFSRPVQNSYVVSCKSEKNVLPNNSQISPIHVKKKTLPLEPPKKGFKNHVLHRKPSNRECNLNILQHTYRSYSFFLSVMTKELKSNWKF